jgi:ectoine hydroxylase-related dioxygenase (phytanoyl-CoA dioxygenase family)
MSTASHTEEQPLTKEQLDHFQREGYVVVPGFLSTEKVAELREFFADLFAKKPQYKGDQSAPVLPEGRGGGVRHDILSRYPELRFLLAEPRFRGALRSVLGRDIALLPEMAAHDSRYGFWHKDTTPIERQGLDFHKSPDFKMVQCAIYLQDNDEYGGGLDVEPGSQHHEDRTPPAPKVTFFDKVGYKLKLKKHAKTGPRLEVENSYSIPNQAGDLVIFDVKLNHQATQPTACETDELPEDQRKFAMFFVASADNQHAERYLEFIGGEYAHLREGHEYPLEVRELAEQHRVKLT